MIKYTGIGSRSTPPEALLAMRALAKHLARESAVLRSGGAQGADQAFAAGAALAQAPATTPADAEIYLPWAGFSGQRGIVADDRHFTAAMQLMSLHHAAWNRLSFGARRLHARNAFQILGLELDQPSQFVICWTPDGAETRADTSITTGGTGSAIRLASEREVPVFNLALDDAIPRMNELLSTLGLAPFLADETSDDGRPSRRRWRHPL